MLKKGYTTGTCAAIASGAAVTMVLQQNIVKEYSLKTPMGICVTVPVLEPYFESDFAGCAVKKYSGDDPDITDGILVYATVRLNNSGIIKIDGGKGVGRVTKAGLQQPIGSAAINDVPRKMIHSAVVSVFELYDYKGGADVIISVPEGEAIAKKTYNPRLGIEGGISILGTSGIVEPMSEQALIDTIRTELSVKKANDGDYVIIAPGNYGVDFVRNTYGVDLNKAVKCSNFVGDALDMAKEMRFKGVVLVGHIGKLVKLSGGIMNTHSKNADCRLELLASATALYTDNINTIRSILNCVTTDDALSLIKGEGILDLVMKKIVAKIESHLKNRLDKTEGNMEVAVVVFSNVYGILAQSENATELMSNIKAGEKH